MSIFKILLAFSSIFSLVINSSCKNQPEGTGETTQLPDSLESAMDFAQYGIAQLYQTWDFPKAALALKKAIELDPDLAVAHIQYGWYLNLMQKDEEAAEYFKSGCLAEPDNPQWRAWRGFHCMITKDFSCMESELKTVLQIDSNFAEVFYIYGLQTLEQNNPNAAIPLMKKAAVNPRFMDGLGYAYAANGDRDSATVIIENMKAADNSWQTLGIAGIFSLLGDYDQAYDWLEKAKVQRHPFFPWARLTPNFLAIRDEPRFKDLYADIGL